MVIKQIPTQWRIIREIPENLNNLANELNERYLGQIALILPTRYMMDTDTVTGPLAVWWTPSDIRHLQTPSTCPQLQHGHNQSPDTRVLRSKILSVLLLKLLMFYLNVNLPREVLYKMSSDTRDISSNTHHMSTAITWSPPEPWDHAWDTRSYH